MTSGRKIVTHRSDQKIITLGMLTMYRVYAIQSRDKNRIYLGQTCNIAKRLRAHNCGSVRSTKKDRPWNLIAGETFGTREKARWAESQIKRSKGRRLKWLKNHACKHDKREAKSTESFYSAASGP